MQQLVSHRPNYTENIRTRVNSSVQNHELQDKDAQMSLSDIHNIHVGYKETINKYSYTFYTGQLN